MGKTPRIGRFAEQSSGHARYASVSRERTIAAGNSCVSHGGNPSPCARHRGQLTPCGANVVLFKRLAGQSRTLVWSAPNVPAPSRMFARERAWSSAAQLAEGSASGVTGDDGDKVARASVEDERLGLSATLYVEYRRA